MQLEIFYMNFRGDFFMRDVIYLSIILPVYNVEKYLEKCLDSIVKQVNEQIENSIEVILINDGSTDNSGIICERYCGKYSYICMHNQENRGLSAARNKGATMATGKYLFFLDSDDCLTNILQELLSETMRIDKDFILGKKDMYFERFSKYIKSDINFEKIDKNDAPIAIFEKLCHSNPCWFTAPLIIINRNFF